MSCKRTRSDRAAEWQCFVWFAGRQPAGSVVCDSWRKINPCREEEKKKRKKKGGDCDGPQLEKFEHGRAQAPFTYTDMAARIAASVTCLLALALPLLGGQAAADGRARMAGGDEWDRLPARHAFKHSFKKPFFLYNTSHEIPHWEIFGSVLATPDFQRLTSSVPLQKGAIWSRLPNPHKAWQAEVAFQVSGRAYMGGDGLAFWYTKERGHAGDVLGNQDAWHGLGILFDTSDPVENRNIPFIAAVWNDGSRHLVGQRITTVANNGGCFRDFRNVGKVWMRITYANATLRLDIDMKGSGPRNYVECFTTHNFPDLPTDYYFGLTAMTSTRGYDDHDIYAFETYELYPHIDPSKLPKRPYEEEHEKKGQQFKFSEEAEKKLDQIELSEETEEEHVPEAVTAQLAKSIQETQLKIIESLVCRLPPWPGAYAHFLVVSERPSFFHGRQSLEECWLRAATR